MKICSKCKQEKDATAFNKRTRAADGLDHWCRECNRVSCIKHNRSEQGQLNALRRNIGKYGLTIEDYETLLNHQNGVCSICQQPERYFPRLSVDHCHETNVVRGLLCNNCNRGLGLLGDDPDNLKRATEYLLGTRSTE